MLFSTLCEKLAQYFIAQQRKRVVVSTWFINGELDCVFVGKERHRHVCPLRVVKSCPASPTESASFQINIYVSAGMQHVLIAF